MELTAYYSRVAMPWGVACPFTMDGETHTVKDACEELFRDDAKKRVMRGVSAMLCPVCGHPFRFPKGWYSDPEDGTGMPLDYWSREIWDSWPEERRAFIQERIPTIEKYLR